MEHTGCAPPTGRLDWRQRDRAEPETSAAAPKREPRLTGRAAETAEAGASRNRPSDAHRQLTTSAPVCVEMETRFRAEWVLDLWIFDWDGVYEGVGRKNGQNF